ncbi:MAG: M28 family peptidase [Prevotella sp.]|jgi:Zn-dependent M28 family amino/carboxypeptidase|nr:M28 family peptidase [Prevotella sp.]
MHRGDLAANSDHYSFATRHVPCIFLENEKGDAFQYYHTIFDTYRTVRSKYRGSGAGEKQKARM